MVNTWHDMNVSTDTLMSMVVWNHSKSRNTRINYETGRRNKREKKETETERAKLAGATTGIGPIFHNKHIFNNNNNNNNNNNKRTFQVEIWKMVRTNVFFFQFPGILCPLNGSETQKGNFGVHVPGLP